MSALLQHYRLKYYKLKVNQENIDKLKEDRKDLLSVNNKTQEHLDAINWLTNLVVRSGGVLKFGFRLRKL